MKIFVLTGSPHRNGTSALLADRLTAGMPGMKFSGLTPLSAGFSPASAATSANAAADPIYNLRRFKREKAAAYLSSYNGLYTLLP